MTDRELINKAYEAMEKAHVPYSGFPVGAALLTVEGRVYTGCNVESASFGATNCAERTAIFKAVSEGDVAFSKIAIVSKGHDPTYPCGICRQVMAEFSPEGQLQVVLDEAGHHERVYSLKDLLPHAFTAADMEEEDSCPK